MMPPQSHIQSQLVLALYSISAIIIIILLANDPREFAKSLVRSIIYTAPQTVAMVLIIVLINNHASAVIIIHYLIHHLTTYNNSHISGHQRRREGFVNNPSSLEVQVKVQSFPKELCLRDLAMMSD